MKKIINGKLYNTDTAELIGELNNGRSYTDLGYCEDALYRKKTGEFFLHGKGGAMTRYAEWVGDCRTGGEIIIPLTIIQAMKWTEKNLTAHKYEEIFGKVEE